MMRSSSSYSARSMTPLFALQVAKLVRPACPLCPQQRRESGHRRRSGLCQKETPHCKKGAETQQTTRPPPEAASFLLGK